MLEGLSSTPADIAISSASSSTMNKAGVNKSASNIFGDMISGMVTGAAGGGLAANIPGAFIGGVFGAMAGFLTGAPMEAFGGNNYMDSIQNSVVSNVTSYDYSGTGSMENIMSTYTRY